MLTSRVTEIMNESLGSENYKAATSAAVALTWSVEGSKSNMVNVVLESSREDGSTIQDAIIGANSTNEMRGSATYFTTT